jgi:hypothetical protein
MKELTKLRNRKKSKWALWGILLLLITRKATMKCPKFWNRSKEFKAKRKERKSAV